MADRFQAPQSASLQEQADAVARSLAQCFKPVDAGSFNAEVAHLLEKIDWNSRATDGAEALMPLPKDARPE